uniref:G_PROTEIN_RECEP_F1_2 domain-containing protein n=1 Tax=Panagrellus redivivus TaxID=6233 RepID=A0A7E4ZYT2_PANRE
MKLFGNLVIQSIIIDMVSSILMTVVQLTVESKDGVVFHGSGDPWLPLPGQWRCSPVMIFAIANNVGFWSVPIQAMYRYVIIVRKRQISPWFSLIIYTSVLLFISSITFPGAFLSETNSNKLQKLQTMKFWHGEDTNTLCAIDVLTWPDLLYFIGMWLLESSGILSLLWLTNRLNKTLYNSQMHFTAKTKRVHKEVTRKLYAQAAIPTTVIVIFVVIAACMFWMPSYYGGLFVLLLMPLPWIVVVNPLVTLYCIKRYRKAAVAILKGRGFEFKGNMSASPTNKGIAVVMGSRSGVSGVVTR